MFTAATDAVPVAVEIDAESDISEPATVDEPARTSATSEIEGVWEFTAPALLEKKRDEIVKAMSHHMGAPSIKKSRALLWSADHSKRIGCTISKRYTKRPSYPYWYAFHPQWESFLAEGQAACVVPGCMDLSQAFAIPLKVIQEVLPDLNTTETERGIYWHLHIVQGLPNSFELLVPKRSANVELSPYLVELV